MSETAIRAEKLSKTFRIGRRQANDTFREVLMRGASAPFRALRALSGKRDGRPPEIQALDEVSFDIQHGEAVGIIGRNGAGKSTLLKVLSRITRPTSGRADIFGRVGSLLEVGTGFHSELTGRENIFLNGAVIGMKRAEIRRRFDEIVAFAEVDKFLDTPVKRYSSGMFVRLAFAVAAHLKPEILLVDEVLSVGDVSFQAKCLEKMHEVTTEGRTVLFVSHSVSAVTRLCQRAVLIDHGRVIADGPAHTVVAHYVNEGLDKVAEASWPDAATAPGGSICRLRAVRVGCEKSPVATAIDIKDPIRVEMEYEVLSPDHVLMPYFFLFNSQRVEIFWSHDLDPRWQRRHRPRGRYVSVVRIPGNLLSEGIHHIEVGCSTQQGGQGEYHVTQGVSFQIVDSLEGDTARGDFAGEMSGVIRPRLQWKTRHEPFGKSVHETPDE